MLVNEELHGRVTPERFEAVLARRIFDGETLTELLSPLELGWKARAQKEGELMAELAPLLRKRAAGREIAGLKAWEEAR